MLTSENRLRVTRRYWIAIALILLTVPALAIDRPLARLCENHGLPGDLRKGLNLVEAFSHGIGVALICVAVFVLDRARRRFLWRLAACPLIAGIMGNLGKCLIARARPSAFDLSQPIMESFGTWLPFLFLADWDHPWQSFPSGHTATAAGFAVGLTWMYPHGRVLFVALTVLAAMQRMAESAHYLSDTLGGAAVGLFAATLICDHRIGGRIYDRLERCDSPPE